MISFCIPAHDEEQLLPGALAAINDVARALSLDFEIVVADDGSTDGTADVAVAAGARVIRIERRLISAAAAASQAIALLQSGCIGGGALVRFEGRVPVWATVMFECMSLTYRPVSFSAGSFMFCEWFGTLGRLALKGSRSMSSREGLDPWYGPRRPDSEHPDPSRRQ